MITLFYGALGVFVAIACPTLSWPVVMVFLIIDLEEARNERH